MASTLPAPEATAKRASLRVRKQPDHYASSPFTSSKRKRNDNDDNEGDAGGDADLMDDDESEEDEDPEDDEPAEEEIRENAKKARRPKSSAPRKPAQKKPRVTNMALPIRAATRAPPRKRALKRGKAVDSQDAEAAGGVFAQVFASGKDSEQVVSEWLKEFGENEAAALADILNFVLKSAGCDGKVTEHDIEDPDSATGKLEDLQEQHQATEPTDYPLIAKGKAAATFRASVAEFMLTLIKSIGAAGYLSSNPEILENLQVWFSPMSSATNRSFRHTSTLCALLVVTGLCEVAKGLATKSADSQRQAETERKKARVNKERVKQIEQKAKAAAADLEEVQALLKDWFDTIFVHRYRDVDPNIRRDCMEALADWIMIMPDHFFDGNHLRYMGWLLSDENPTVRADDVKNLRRLYKDSSKLGGLKTFTERFRPRMVEMGTSDADINVRVAALELLDLLRANDLLEPDDIDAVGRLIFHEDVRVRKAVARFFSASVDDLLTSKIDDLGGSEAFDEALPDIDDSNIAAPRLAWLRFKSVAEMLQAYDQEDAVNGQFERNRADGSLILHAIGVESRFTLAVDVLYDKVDDLQDWQALAGYLLFDHSSGHSNGVGKDALSQFKHEAVLAENEEIILLEVLNACVKRSMSDLAENFTGTKSKLTKKQKEDLQEEQEESVRNLTELIPRLLKKFGDVPSTAGAVLRLEGVLALPALQSLRQDSAANAALLDDLRKQFMSHGSDEVLAPATAAILHAQSYGELDETAMEKITSLWEDVVGNLAELLQPNTITVRGASGRDELQALSNNLLRIVRLATVSNCIQPLEDKSIAAKDDSIGKDYRGAVDFIVDLVLRATHSAGVALDPEEATLEDLVAARAAEAALFYFRWKFSAIMNAVKSGASDDLAFEMLEALAQRRDACVDNLAKVLDSRRAGDAICVSIAGSMLDLYTSAAILRTETAQPGTSDDYTVLIMDLEAEHEKAVMKVFQGAEKEYAKLNGKKLEEVVLDDADSAEDVNDDPVDDDPLSEDEEDEIPPPSQTHRGAEGQASQWNRDAKLLKPVIAEERLCQFTTKLLYAILAGVIDGKATRQRLERNKTRLGANYKEVLAYLDVSGRQKAGKKSAAKGKPKAATAAVKTTAKTTATVNGTTGKKGRASAKSNAIVAESEDEDEIVDDEEEEDEEDHDDDDDDDDGGGDEKERMRRRGLTVEEDGRSEDEEMAPAPQDQEDGDGDGEEAESVLGD